MQNADFKQLLQKAGTLLAKRSFSRGDLRDHLARTAGPVAVEPVLDRLEQLNLLNDADYAYNFALRRITRHHWGAEKILGALLRHQVAEAIALQALERIRSEIGMGPEDSIRKYCDQRGIPGDIQGLRRLYGHLLRQGFEEDQILSALRQTVPPTLWQRFETGE